MYNRTNYMVATKATFKGCKTPKRKPDYESNSGSRYWYGCDSVGPYVIRESNHWSYIKLKRYNANAYGCGRVASCFWTIIDMAELKAVNGIQVIPEWFTGKAYFRKFKENTLSIRSQRKIKKRAVVRERAQALATQPNHAA